MASPWGQVDLKGEIGYHDSTCTLIEWNVTTGHRKANNKHLMNSYDHTPLRVCYFGTYRANYSRNQIMVAGLRAAGVQVIECHTSLWHGVQDRVQAFSGEWKYPRFWLRVLKTYSRLLRQYRAVGDYDVMVVGYPGQFDVYLAWCLSRWRRKPLVWDIFMSIYLIAQERGLVEQHPIIGQVIRLVERWACRLPDLLIQDTAEYVAWLQNTHDVAPERFRLVPTGADDRVFYTIGEQRSSHNRFTALYYGTFIPNHGVGHIVEAARILRDEDDIHFELIGRGPCRAEVEAQVQRYGLTNVTLVDWIDKQALPERVAQADVCLGAFGATPQSLMTVQNKIYEGMAMGKAVITGDSPTVRGTFTHGKHIYLCQRENPQSLAQALLQLKEQPTLRASLAENGHRYYQMHFTVAQLGQRFKQHLLELLSI
jgi:glycosyltransferase involved in cell wall biosynthesis